jgi:hypothetical protein
VTGGPWLSHRIRRRIVFLEPGFRGFGIGEDLEVIAVSDLLPGIDVRQKLSLVSLQLALAPMGLFAIGIENPLDMTVHARINPIRAIIVGPLRLHSISASIAACHSGNSDSFKGEQLPAVGQSNGILKRGRPGHGKSFS